MLKTIKQYPLCEDLQHRMLGAHVHTDDGRTLMVEEGTNFIEEITLENASSKRK